MKSDRLKKLEKELRDLETWLGLGLVSKKDLQKYREEMDGLQLKIDEEKQRLLFVRESGATEDYGPLPKRSNQKQLYNQQSIPDIETGGTTEIEFDLSTTLEADHSSLFDVEMPAGEERASSTQEYGNEDEDPYSDKNRWRRWGSMVNPDDES